MFFFFQKITHYRDTASGSLPVARRVVVGIFGLFELEGLLRLFSVCRSCLCYLLCFLPCVGSEWGDVEGVFYNICFCHCTNYQHGV